ncbi:MAG: hypothetical protein KDD53_05255, partial [Bdellovibrionales bacterium]|nr:hypothetical protein [Bdellovibrionales bacterium]
MASQIPTNFRIRRSYARLPNVAEIPHLIAVQKKSYDRFLQTDVDPDKREELGLQKVFKSVFPIKDYNGTTSLEFVSYTLGTPKYDVDECRDRGMTWAAPLRVTIQLVLWETNPETNVRTLSALKEDTVYFGEIPLMTDRGTFMINGTERVVVTQLHRSPGVFFDHDKGKSHPSGKLLYSARIIPYRGSWIDLEFDIKDVLHVRIDRRRKLPASVLLRALGMTSDQILAEYYRFDTITFQKNGLVTKKFMPNQLEGQKAFKQVKIDGKVLVKKGGKFNRAVIRRLKEANIEDIEIDPETIVGMVSADTILEAADEIVHPTTGEILVDEGELLVGYEQIVERLKEPVAELSEEDQAELLSKFDVLVVAGEELTGDKLSTKGEVLAEGTVSVLQGRGLSSIRVLYLDDHHIGDSLWKTLVGDKMQPERDDILSLLLNKPATASLIEIYRRLRPGDPPRPETAAATFENLFFNEERYDLSAVGRLKMNYKLYVAQGKEAPPVEQGVLSPADIVETVRYLLELKNSNDPMRYSIDDIDHLGNRRVRPVGELIENQYRIGLVRMERAVKERMGMQ